jgi:hypothetical protein
MLQPTQQQIKLTLHINPRGRVGRVKYRLRGLNHEKIENYWSALGHCDSLADQKNSL